MKQYKVEMLRRGKWVTARPPFGSDDFSTVFDNRPECNREFLFIKSKWEKAKEALPEHIDTFPMEFRIVSREVSDWVMEEDQLDGITI